MPHIPWDDMTGTGMREKLVHDYMGVDLALAPPVLSRLHRRRGAERPVRVSS
jgi:uncharacterized protein with HEPN domain